jgi:glucans biosynthesis protein C
LNQRYEGLDAIRATAMLLGLAYHAAYPWLPDVGRWYFVADANPIESLVLLTGALHAFRMELFFALSGFFSHLVFERRGPGGFLRDRSKRLLVPLLVATPVILFLDVTLRSASQARGLMSPLFETGAGFRAAPLHLWFLISLCVFCALAFFAPSWSGPPKWLQRALHFPPLLLLLAVPTCVGLWLHPENKPDLHFWPMPYETFHYGLFFAFGWWLWPVKRETSRLQGFAPYFLAAGLALAFVIFRGPLQWDVRGQVGAGLVAWLITLGALGLALSPKTMERREPPALRFLVESSYWTYLVHYPVVLALQLFFVQQSLPGVVEYALTIALTLTFAWVTFVLFVRRTPLGPWLGVRPMKPL